MKQPLLVFGSLSLAVLLLGALVVLGDVEFGLVLGTLRRIGWGAFALIVLAATVILALSAGKWKLATEKLLPKTAPQGEGLFVYFHYTCLGATMGQILPLHVSTIAVRGIGLKLDHRTPISHGMSSSFVEQLFDIMVPMACVGPGLLLFFGLIDFSLFVASSAILVVLSGALIVLLVPRLAIRSEAHTPRHGFLRSRLAWLRAKCRHYFDNADGRLMWQLYALSVLRFAVVAATTVFIALAAGFAIDPVHIIASIPLVQLSFLIALTPAGIGIAEWTWAGLLYGFGVGLDTATEFALVHRLLGVAALVLLTVGLYAVRLILPVTRGFNSRDRAAR